MGSLLINPCNFFQSVQMCSTFNNGNNVMSKCIHILLHTESVLQFKMTAL